MQCCQTEKYISIHSLRMEGDIRNVAHRHIGKVFQSTPSAWRETTLSAADMADWTFQSTPSAWRETLEGHCSEQSISHFNPLPPHGGRHDVLEGDHGGKVRICQRGISIHSLRMEGDHTKYKLVYMQTLISIHSLRMEGDVTSQTQAQIFRNFNPLPPHGGRPGSCVRT